MVPLRLDRDPSSATALGEPKGELVEALETDADAKIYAMTLTEGLGLTR